MDRTGDNTSMKPSNFHPVLQMRQYLENTYLSNYILIYNSNPEFWTLRKIQIFMNNKINT